MARQANSFRDALKAHSQQVAGLVYQQSSFFGLECTATHMHITLLIDEAVH